MVDPFLLVEKEENFTENSKEIIDNKKQVDEYRQNTVLLKLIE